MIKGLVRRLTEKKDDVKKIYYNQTKIDN